MAHLERVPPSDVVPERDAVTCDRLVAAYNRYQARYRVGAPIRRAAIVHAGPYWAVEDSATAGARGCCWEVRLIDRAGVVRYSYGAGS
jgi:hypothetical protein